jgi:sucrose-6-phosphate hydrolase SacC (GH32 family)
MTRLGSGRMNSGGCFVNKDGVATMIYNDSGRGDINHLAFSVDDNLEEWSDACPVQWKVRPDQDGSKISNWDPDGWRQGDTHYALFGRHPFQGGTEGTLLKSSDCRTWDYVGPFMTREMPDVARSADIKVNEDLSCPTFFKLGHKWMLLCISHVKGCRYYLGEWKNEQFTPDYHARMNWCLSDGMVEGDHGGEFFAPESLETPDGRRVMWTWCFASSKSSGNELWDGIQSLPRELSLPGDGVLRIRPLRELEQLRYSPTCAMNLAVESGTTCRLQDVAGDALELMVTIAAGEARRFGVRVLCDKDNGKGLDIVVEPGSKSLRVGATVAPFELKRREDVRLRIFVDRRVVEVFANDRQAVVKQHDYAPGDVGVCLFSEGGRMVVKEVKSWKMQPANAW